MRVCNWENRQIVPTVPGLAYWFGGFLRIAGVAEFLANLCCAPDEHLAALPLSGAALMGGNADAQAIFIAFKAQLDQFLKKLLPQ